MSDRIPGRIHGCAFALAVLGIASLSLAGSCSGKRDKDERKAAGASSAGSGQGGAASSPTDGVTDGVTEDGADQPVVSGERDPRTQYDLAADIKRAETAKFDDADAVWHEVRRDYHGKRFTWTVFYSPALCAAADRCHVIPFDRTGQDKKIVQGWMPRLALSADEFARLQKTCAGKQRCQVRFTGTLHRLTLSADHMTSLSFTDVEILPVQ